MSDEIKAAVRLLRLDAPRIARDYSPALAGAMEEAADSLEREPQLLENQRHVVERAWARIAALEAREARVRALLARWFTGMEVGPCMLRQALDGEVKP